MHLIPSNIVNRAIPEAVGIASRAHRRKKIKVESTPAPITLSLALYSQKRPFSPYTRNSSQRSESALIRSIKTSLHSPRCFSTNIRFQKGKKTRILEEDAETDQSVKTKIEKAGNDTALQDAMTLASLNAEIRRIQDKLQNVLNHLKPGGRFNPSLIEALRVDLTKLTQIPGSKDPVKDAQNMVGPNIKHINKNRSAKPPPTMALVSELAQVIPRGGRTVLIMLNEEAFLKPVSSAILSSPYSLNPQVSAENPLELIVPIPPPTAETRKQTVAQVDKFKEKAEYDLREARGSMHKSLRNLSLENRIRQDDHHDAKKRMEKAVDEAKVEIKRICDASRKALSQG